MPAFRLAPLRPRLRRDILPTFGQRYLAALLLPAVLLFSGTSLGQEPEAAEAAPPPGTLVPLIDPAIAEALELTDSQKQRIASIVEERAAALAEADDEARPTIVADAEQQLEEVLTDDQRVRWQRLMAAPAEGEADAVADVPEKTMRFNFRFQPWSDVLSWFANEAGLSLVLDAPPPGTFNYTDAREYTLAEAIDLLNGVLLTKGYTLIRRERMLVVINFASGVPTELVPRITIEELDKRGQFELVSVLFPIGDRDPEAVHSEIKPLVGEHGSSVLLPQTRQVLVTETAGKMRAIRAVIDSIPTPRRERSEPRKEPEKPSLAVYPLESIDPNAALEIIRALMSDIKIVHDPNLNQLTAFATPTQQAGIQKALDEMRADVPPELQRRLKVYPIKGTNTEELLTFLGSLAPDARLGFDPQTGNLAAWAAPPEQELIADALSSMRRDGESDGDVSVETHRLNTAQASELVTMLTSVVPEAKVVASSTSNSIVALASNADQEKIRSVIAQLEADSPAEDQPEVRFYPFDRPDRTTLITALGKLAPRADVTFDDKSKQLVVLARPAEHETVGTVIEQFLAENRYRPSDARLKVYQLSPELRRKLESALSTLADDFQGVRTIADSSDANSGQVAIWASGDQHAKVENLIAELDQEVPLEQRQRLVTYRVESADPASVMNVLQSLLPGTRLVLDTKSRQIVAWARPDEHEVIAGTVEQMDGDQPADRRFQLMSHPVGDATASTALTMLANLLPDVQLVQDPAAGTIVAFARASDHEVIAETLRRMQPEVPEEKRPQVVVYPVPKADPIPLASMLQSVFPQARISGDRVSGTVTAWGTNDDHEMIRSAVEQMTADPPEDQAPKVVVYQFPSASAASAAYRSLRNVLPEARLSVDSNSANLVAWGTPSDHEFLRSAIEQIEGNVDASKQQELAIYPLDEVDPRAVSSLLRSAMPSASFNDDRRNGTMLVWATKEEHETISAAIDKLRNNPSSKANRTAQRYRLENTEPSAVTSAIRAIAPDADSVIDVRSGDLVVTALPHEHESIATAIEQIESNVDPSKEQELVIYTLDDVDPRSVTQLLSSAMPSASFNDDRRNGTMLVWATKDEHETIRESIDRMRNNPSSKANRTARRYRLENTDPSAAMVTVQALAPDAQPVVDTRSGHLVVTALPREHDAISAALSELDGNDRENGAQVRVYPLEVAQASDVYSTLLTLFAARPEVRLSLDPTTQKLVVSAAPSQHEMIQRLIGELDGGQSPLDTLQLEVHALGNADADAVSGALTPLFAKTPEVRLIPDGSSGNLVALARPGQQATIRTTIAQMQGEAEQVEVFQLHQVDPYLAELSINRLFASDAMSRYRRSRSGEPDDTPKVDSDSSTGQLYVRAKPEQIEQIRDLLTKMGETGLGVAAAPGGGKLRVIPLNGRSARQAMAEIEGLWSQMRGNPIRVVTPSALAPTRRRTAEDRWPATTEEPPNAVERRSVSPQPDLPGLLTPEVDDGAARNAEEDVPLLALAIDDDDDAPLAEPLPEAKNDAAARAAANQPAQEDRPAGDNRPPSDDLRGAAPPEEEAEPAAAPIIIAPGPDSITITSEDLEALDQFEALLRSLAQQRGPAGGREFTVFNLHHANAEVVAESLEKLFSQGFFGSRGTAGVTIVPDQRLNSLVVQANQNDLRAIENLLEVLDSSEVPETLIATKPTRIRLHNAKAAAVAEVLREVYKSQLAAGGPQLPIPSGVPRELASALQQIRAVSTGPLMTLGVDETSNSLIVLAPPPLLVEVQALVTTLDDAATEPNRTVRVVPLKKTNTETVQQALEMLMNEGGSESRFRRSYRRSR